MAASASSVEYTPQASSHGSVRSSYLKPRTSNPLTYVSAQSLRALISASTSPTSSLAKLFSSPSSKTSARFSSNSPSRSTSSGTSVISTLPSARVTISGSSISISKAGCSSMRSSPMGAAYRPLSIKLVAMIFPSNRRHVYGEKRQVHLAHHWATV